MIKEKKLKVVLKQSHQMTYTGFLKGEMYSKTTSQAVNLIILGVDWIKKKI